MKIFIRYLVCALVLFILCALIDYIFGIHMSVGANLLRTLVVIISIFVGNYVLKRDEGEPETKDTVDDNIGII